LKNLNRGKKKIIKKKKLGFSLLTSPLPLKPFPNSLLMDNPCAFDLSIISLVPKVPAPTNTTLAVTNKSDWEFLSPKCGLPSYTNKNGIVRLYISPNRPSQRSRENASFKTLI